MTSIERVPGRSGLLQKLLASVRAEFRSEIYHPAPDDPVFVRANALSAAATA